jgi:hypothetical protein
MWDALTAVTPWTTGVHTIAVSARAARTASIRARSSVKCTRRILCVPGVSGSSVNAPIRLTSFEGVLKTSLALYDLTLK